VVQTRRQSLESTLPNMPYLEALGQGPPPKRMLFDDLDGEFKSPDGRWVLQLVDPFEWAMGGYGWNVRLQHGRRDVSDKHVLLRTLAGGKGFQGPEHLQPWSFDSKTICLLTWRSPPALLYDPSTRRRRPLARVGFPTTAKWAPDRDRLLLASYATGIVTSRSGWRKVCTNWKFENYSCPYVFWLNPGDFFATVGRPSSRAKTRISFYSGRNGGWIGSLPLDPADLLPYEDAKYSCVQRDRFSLELCAATRGAGSLLNVWSEVQFESRTNTLSLGAYRPNSKPFTRGGQKMCRAELRWVNVRIHLQRGDKNNASVE